MKTVGFKGVGLKGHHSSAEKLLGLWVIVGLKGVGLKGHLVYLKSRQQKLVPCICLRKLIMGHCNS